LPAVLSPDTIGKFNLQLSPDSTYYPETNPAIKNEFATAAYRFGHSLVNDVFEGKDQPWLLSNAFGDARFAVFENQTTHGAENELEGMCAQPMLAMDRYITKELTQNLYMNKNIMNNSTKGKGFDLAALNIQRGRDHGVPGYNDVRAALGLQRIPSMEYKPVEIDQEGWDAFKQVYKSPDDIDLYPAGLAEQALPGGILGPTFSHMIGDQFRVIKDGDRFFYTHSKGPGAGGYPTDIQNMIMRIRLSDVICSNTHIEELQGNVFMLENGASNAMEKCNDPHRLQKLDLTRILDNALQKYQSTNPSMQG